MRRLLPLFLVLGCGAEPEYAKANPTQTSAYAETSPEQRREAVAALERQKGKVTRDSAGRVVKVNFIAARHRVLDLTPLGLLPHVEELRLEANGRISDSHLASVASLARLRVLRLGGGLMTNAGLAHLAGLTRLERLDFDSCKKFTDAGLRHLAGLKRLSYLNLRSTRVTDAGLVHLRGLTALEELLLDFTPTGDAGLVHLRGLERLRRLGLTQTRVKDAGLEHLQHLKGLKDLDLDSTRVTDTGVEHLTVLPKLEKLNLRDTKISDHGLDLLGRIATLKKVELFGTRIRWEAVRRLERALPQCEVVVKDE